MVWLRSLTPNILLESSTQEELFLNTTLSVSTGLSALTEQEAPTQRDKKWVNSESLYYQHQ